MKMRESKRYNQKSTFYSAVWSDDCTALFVSTKKGVNKFVYILFFVVRRYPSNIRAPPI